MRIRYSLKFLLITLFLVGALAGASLRLLVPRPHCDWDTVNAATLRASKYRVISMWRQDTFGGGRPFLYAVVIPGYVTDFGSAVGNGVPINGTVYDLWLHIGGVECGGVKVPAEGAEFLFVFTKDHTLRPIRGLTPDEIGHVRAVTSGVQLINLAAWKRRVEPAIDEENEFARIDRLRKTYERYFAEYYPNEASRYSQAIANGTWERDEGAWGK
jgi:hypothetical protein